MAESIIKMKDAKKDYGLDTRHLRMTDTGLLAFNVKDVGEREVKPTRLCLTQIGNRVGIPSKYLDRLATDAPKLLAQNVNHWFQTKPEVRMLRTIQNGEQTGRAFLSNQYRPFDNFDLVNSVLPEILKAGCEVQSCELTETRLYLQCTTPKLQAIIDQRKSEAGIGGHQRADDVVQAGVVISNSEVGCGSIRVEPMIYRLVCKNGLILPTALKRHHVGRAGEGDWESGDAYEVFSDETRRLDDRAFWAKVNDVVKASLNEIKFLDHVAKLNKSTEVDIGKAQEAVEIISERYSLAKDESDNILNHLARGGDGSLWGLVNAITRTAEDVVSYDRAIDLERIGGMALELPANTFGKN